MNICKHCGREALYYYPTTSTWCCSKPHQKCPGIRKKFAEAKKGIKRAVEIGKRHSNVMKGKKVKPNAKPLGLTLRKCEYGCGQTAKFIFDNGKVCCSENYRSCPKLISNKKSYKVDPKAKRFKNSIMICNFGCKQLAKFIFKNGKVCCSEYSASCKGRPLPTNETKEKIRQTLKKPLDYWIQQYPIFTKIEELRESAGEIQVHCKNYNCPNSKENEGWFTPSYIQLYERMRSIEKQGDGQGEANFYCSEECKQSCSIYKKSAKQLIREDQERAGIIKPNYYTTEEYQIWRKEVLERANNKCEYCGEEATHCHHIQPQKLEPFFSLDPDYGLACCEKCHYEKGHKDECSTGQLAQRICK